MLHERRFFFLASKAIVFTLSCVYGRSLFTGYLTNVINPTVRVLKMVMWRSWFHEGLVLHNSGHSLTIFSIHFSCRWLWLAVCVQVVLMATHVDRFCTSKDGEYVNDSASASAVHLSEVFADFFDIGEDEADAKVMQTFMFPTTVTTSNPSGRSAKTCTVYYRRPIAHFRSRVRTAFADGWMLWMHEHRGIGKLSDKGVPVWTVDEIVGELENERFRRATENKGARVAGVKAVDKELGGRTGWFVAGTADDPASHLKCSVPHAAFFNMAVRSRMRIISLCL